MDHQDTYPRGPPRSALPESLRVHWTKRLPTVQHHPDDDDTEICDIPDLSMDAASWAELGVLMDDHIVLVEQDSGVLADQRCNGEDEAEGPLPQSMVGTVYRTFSLNNPRLFKQDPMYDVPPLTHQETERLFSCVEKPQQGPCEGHLSEDLHLSRPALRLSGSFMNTSRDSDSQLLKTVKNASKGLEEISDSSRSIIKQMSAGEDFGLQGPNLYPGVTRTVPAYQQAASTSEREPRPCHSQGNCFPCVDSGGFPASVELGAETVKQGLQNRFDLQKVHTDVS